MIQEAARDSSIFLKKKRSLCPRSTSCTVQTGPTPCQQLIPRGKITFCAKSSTSLLSSNCIERWVGAFYLYSLQQLHCNNVMVHLKAPPHTSFNPFCNLYDTREKGFPSLYGQMQRGSSDLESKIFTRH